MTSLLNRVYHWGRETDPSYLLNRLFLWIEPVIIEFRCVYFFGGVVKWRTIEPFDSFTGCHTLRANHLVGGYIIAYEVIYCCFWHGHVSFISLSQVDRFLSIECDKHKTPHSFEKRGFNNQSILPSYNVKGIYES
jgi:hypothetical protein